MTPNTPLLRQSNGPMPDSKNTAIQKQRRLGDFTPFSRYMKQSYTWADFETPSLQISYL